MLDHLGKQGISPLTSDPCLEDFGGQISDYSRARKGALQATTRSDESHRPLFLLLPIGSFFPLLRFSTVAIGITPTTHRRRHGYWPARTPRHALARGCPSRHCSPESSQSGSRHRRSAESHLNRPKAYPCDALQSTNLGSIVGHCFQLLDHIGAGVELRLLRLDQSERAVARITKPQRGAVLRNPACPGRNGRRCGWPFRNRSSDYLAREGACASSGRRCPGCIHTHVAAHVRA